MRGRRIHLVKIIGAVSVVVGFAAVTQGAEDYTQWSDSVKIILNTDSTGADLGSYVDGFPVLVKLTPDNFDGFPNTKPGGADIRFTGDTYFPAGLGSQPYWAYAPRPYEIQRWVDGASDMDTAEIWVLVDRVMESDSAQYLVMYYGNTDAADSSNGEAVFDPADGFLGVWHLEEDAAGTATTGLYKDATTAGADGDDYVSGASVAGVAGLAAEFNGSSDYIEVQNFTDDSIPQLTVSCWVKPNDQSIWTSFISKDVNDISTGGFALRRSSDDKFIHSAYVGSSKWEVGSWGSASLDDGATWYYVLGTLNGANQICLFVDATVHDCREGAAGAVKNVTNPLYFGRQVRPTASTYLSGAIDEVRIENVRRSDNWIKLCHENQKVDQTLVSIATFEETGVRNAPTQVRDGGIAVERLKVVGLASPVFRGQASAVYDMTGRQLPTKPWDSRRQGVVIITTAEQR